MSTLTRTTDIDQTPSVDEVMGQIVAELGGSLGILLTDLGLRAGLWLALRGAGPVGAVELSERTGVAAALTREWLRSQAAAGYLTYRADEDSYVLPETVAIAILDAPGGAMLAACTEMMQSMLRGYDAFTVAFTGDGRFGWHERDLHYWRGTDRLTRTQLPAKVIAAAVEAMPGVVEGLDDGGRILDVGCGFGFPTTVLAQRFPQVDVVGVDYHGPSVDQARAAALATGAANRLTFDVAAATDLPGSGYALVTFFDSLHDFGDPVAALRAAREVLTPGGAVLVCDNAAGPTVADNLDPVGRMYYAVSTLICTPNALSQQTAGSPPPLGTYAGAEAIAEVARSAGFCRVSTLQVPGAMNLFLDLRP